MSGDGRGQNKEAYDTGYSQAVTHPSTNPARQSLTSVIGREPVFFFLYLKSPKGLYLLAIIQFPYIVSAYQFFHYDVRVVFITLHVFEFVFITFSCNNTISLQCFYLSVSFITIYVLFALLIFAFVFIIM